MIRRISLLVVLAAVIAGVGYVALRPKESGVEVEVTEAARRDIFRSWVTASGEIVATRYADIGTDIMGKVVSLPVAEGQGVRSGQVLARIDPVQAQSELETVEAQVRVLEAEREATLEDISAADSQIARIQALQTEAQLNLSRAEQLLERGIVARAEVDRARAEFDRLRAEAAAAEAALQRSRETVTVVDRRILQAQAQVRRARDIVTKTEIRAPISGVVSRLNVREGEMVVVGIQNQPGTTLMTVSDLSGVNAEVKVAEAEILRVQLGQTARVMLDALPGREFSGQVVEIGTSALLALGLGSAAREFKVVIRIDEADPGLRPGLTCDAEILTEEREGAVTVPLQAVVIREMDGREETGVFLFEGQTAGFRPVRPGIIGGLDMAVEGLEPGVRIISGPFQVLRELQPGATVRLAP